MAPIAGPFSGNEHQITSGFWGPVSSTLDWCESNYLTTDYIAEFWNTMSNIIFIIPPFFGILFAWQDKVDLRYILSYIGVICIGVGSTAFHMTLSLHAQMLDEMSMLWSTSLFVYCLMETNSKSQSTNVSLILILLCYNAIASHSYVVLQHPLLFQFAFGSLTVILVARAVHMSRTQDCSSCRFLMCYAVIMYAVAFTLWNMDNLCCEYVQWIRNSLPACFTALTQLHAWWHFLVGIACHSQILVSCYVRCIFLKHRCTIKLWFGFLPFLRVHANESSDEVNRNKQQHKDEVASSMMIHTSVSKEVQYRGAARDRAP